MKLYTINDETNLLTEVQFLKRTHDWRVKNISRLDETKDTLREIKKFYVDEGLCVLKSSGVFGNEFRFTATNEKAPLADAARWPYAVSHESDCIICNGNDADDARVRVTRLIQQHIDEIDAEIKEWGKKFPEHQEFTFDESVLTKQDEAYSSLEELEEDVKNH